MPRNLIGEVLLNQYRVDRYLASGGMATIYLVWDLRRRVNLAMKVLHPELAEDPSFIARFQREANSLEKLVHPHIVTFYGLFKDGDLTFLLERFVDGPSLDEVLRKRAGQPLPVLDAMVYFKALYTSLGYAHDQGIIHCDVKPGNVLVDQGGSVFLTDFGISRYMDGSATTTSAMGTPLYMAPEQVRGEHPTPQTDVYSLGVLLFELLAGRRPFVGDGNLPPQAGVTPIDRIRYQQVYTPVPDLRKYNPQVPPDLVRVVETALAKDPGRRYATIEAMAEDVEQAIRARFEALPDRVRLVQNEASLEETNDSGWRENPDRSWPATNHPQPERQAGLSRRAMLILLAAGILTLCGLVGFGLFQVVARGLPFLTGGPNSTATAVEQSLTPVAAGATETLPSGPQPTIADSETAVPGAATDTPIVTGSPSGEIVVVMRAGGGGNALYLLNLENGSLEALPTVPNVDVVYSDMPQWSPDGARLTWRSSYGGRPHIVIMDRIEWEPYQIAAGEAFGRVESPAFLPDSSRVSFWADGSLAIADAISGNLLEQTALFSSTNLFVWNPRSDLLAFSSLVSGNRDLIVSGSVNTSDRKIETGGVEYAPAWSVDGEKLAFQSDAGRDPGKNEIWTAGWDGSGLEKITSSPAESWSRAPTWSPDGNWIAFVSDQAGGSGPDHGELFVVNLQDGQVHQLTETGGQVYDWRPAWRP